MAADSIDDVVRLVSAVVDDARATQHRRGYFAAIYRQMTVAIRDAIGAGRFDDGARMSHFAAVFASRYLDALAQYEAASVGPALTRSWRVAFDCDGRHDQVILQHLMASINAHVNLDLGVAAAEVAPGAAIGGLKADFERINAVIGSLLDAVQTAVNRFSPLLALLRTLSEGPEDAVLNFSFETAREEAWQRAVLLAGQAPDVQAAAIDSIDRATAVLGRLVVEPGGIMGQAVAIVHHTENEDVPAVIDALAAVTPSTTV